MGGEEPAFEDDFEKEEASVHTRFTAWRGAVWERCGAEGRRVRVRVRVRVYGVSSRPK